MRLSLIPSARTFKLLLLASFLLLLDTGLALAADALILLLALVDGRRTHTPSAKRDVPGISALAAVTDVALTVTNPAGRAVTVKLTDDLDPCLRRVGSADGVDPWDDGVQVEIPARSSVQCSYRVTPRTRGFLSLGTIHLRTLSPWGLAWRRSSEEVLHTLQVQPGVRDLLRNRGGHAIRRQLRTPGQRRNRQWGEGREFESLRDYAQGDDPRSIDWKASAKRRKYVVRNYEAERSQNIVLAIDAGRHMRERLSPLRERIDYALGACMMLASRAQNFGDRIGVVVFDDRIRHLSPPRRADPAALAKVLAGVETRLVEPNYPLALATLGRTFRKRSLVILFCDVIDGSVSRALVSSLSRIVRAHLPLAIAIRNPALEGAATQPVARPEDGYFRAAAEELVQARATTLQVMRQSGILVVDTPPGRHAGPHARQVRGDQGAGVAVGRGGLTARGQNPPGIRAAMHPRWPLRSPLNNVMITFHYGMWSIHWYLVNLRSALLLGRIALLFTFRRALPARRLAALGARAALSTDC